MEKAHQMFPRKMTRSSGCVSLNKYVCTPPRIYGKHVEWQFTPVFLPGETYGHRSLAGSSPWGQKESDTTEWLTLSHFYFDGGSDDGGGGGGDGGGGDDGDDDGDDGGGGGGDGSGGHDGGGDGYGDGRSVALSANPFSQFVTEGTTSKTVHDNSFCWL